MSSHESYPEHEKLHAVADVSQEIGEFLDFGLARQNLMLYERITRDCECQTCEQRKGHRSRWHTDEEIATVVDGRVQIEECVPTSRTIQSILATYFGIDQSKIDAEKEAMLTALRGAK